MASSIGQAFKIPVDIQVFAYHGRIALVAVEKLGLKLSR
jgi:hypothetical protein